MTDQPSGLLVDLVDLVDQDGYPTDAALNLIRTFTGTPRELVEDLLFWIFDAYGGVTVTDATDDYDRPVKALRLVTGGWSGCEDATGALRETMFWFAWWQTSRRGGAFDFAIPAEQWETPMVLMPRRPRHLDDTVDVAEMMRAYGHPMSPAPTTGIPDEARVLWVRMLLSEALEFADAMGCVVTTPGHDLVEKATFDVGLDTVNRRGIDLVEAADALADVLLVDKAAALTLGIPIDQATEIVHVTNMAKLGPDGQPTRRSDGKVIKPDGWIPPTEALRALLIERGWNEAA